MAKAYEAPSLVQVGEFHKDTGEFLGRYEEAMLPFDDQSP